MKLQKLLTHVAGLAVSLNVYAADSQDKPVFLAPQQTQSIIQASFNQPRLNSPVHAGLNPGSMEATGLNSENELMAELGVYLLIIAVYSFYGLKVNAKK